MSIDKFAQNQRDCEEHAKKDTSIYKDKLAIWKRKSYIFFSVVFSVKVCGY